jgi:hypothetical protein
MALAFNRLTQKVPLRAELLKKLDKANEKVAYTQMSLMDKARFRFRKRHLLYVGFLGYFCWSTYRRVSEVGVTKYKSNLVFNLKRRFVPGLAEKSAL